MKREEANGDLIRPGDVYKYSCRNDQGYGYLQFVACSSCGAFGDVGLMDAVEARNRWNRGPIQIRAEVA